MTKNNNGEKTKSSTINIILVLLLAVGVGVGIYKYTTNTTTPTNKERGTLSSDEKTKPLELTVEPSFSEEGNLVDARNGAGTWVLIYEAPGSPALQAVLLFDSESICNIGNGEEKCDEDGFTEGDRVRVEGTEENGAVTVTYLETSEAYNM